MAEHRKAGCDCNCIHEDVITKVRGLMPVDEDLSAVTGLYKLFGDRTRLNILAALSCNEMCVCDLAVMLDMTKSAVSHQLKVLRVGKLVTFNKVGKHSYYRLADGHVRDILSIALHHVREEGCD